MNSHQPVCKKRTREKERGGREGGRNGGRKKRLQRKREAKRKGQVNHHNIILTDEEMAALSQPVSDACQTSLSYSQS